MDNTTTTTDPNRPAACWLCERPLTYDGTTHYCAGRPTYSYMAIDAGGNSIDRQGLDWTQLRNHVSNLVCCGYRMSITDSNGNQIATDEVR